MEARIIEEITQCKKIGIGELVAHLFVVFFLISCKGDPLIKPTKSCLKMFPFLDTYAEWNVLDPPTELRK